LLSCWVSCARYQPPATHPPPTNVKIVGSVANGVVTLKPGENAALTYPVVTKDFVYYFYFLVWETREQALKIESLEAKLKNK